MRVTRQGVFSPISRLVSVEYLQSSVSIVLYLLRLRHDILSKDK